MFSPGDVTPPTPAPLTARWGVWPTRIVDTAFFATQAAENIRFRQMYWSSRKYIVQGVCRYKCRSDSKCSYGEGPCNRVNAACEKNRNVCQVRCKSVYDNSKLSLVKDNSCRNTNVFPSADYPSIILIPI